MSSIDRQQLPAGLNEEPGPALCAALDNVEPWRLTAEDTAMILQAWQSQVAYTQARFMEAMVALGSCRTAPRDTVAHYPEPPEHASDEVRVALTWTRRAAENQFYLALDLQHRIPAAHQALLQGRLDLPRAKVLADWTRDLTPEQAQRLCGLLLPEAMQLTTGQLTERAKHWPSPWTRISPLAATAKPSPPAESPATATPTAPPTSLAWIFPSTRPPQRAPISRTSPVASNKQATVALSTTYAPTCSWQCSTAP